MGQGEKRLNINNLVPGERYAIQVRSVDEGQGSTWSQKYSVKTIDDTAGGTRTPTAPVLDTWAIDGAGHYSATWATNFTNTDGTLMVVKRYELELSAPEGTYIAPHYVGSGATQSRSFTLNTVKGFFDGVIPVALTARLRIINSADTPSEWSAPLVASLPVPNPPVNPIALGVIDAVKVSWEPPADPIHLHGYRVYVKMGDDNFLPDPLNRTGLVYEGPGTEFTYTSLSYSLMHYFKVVSYSAPGLESTFVTCEAKPKSPYGPDDIAPTTPVLGTPTMDRTTVTAPKANVSWTFDATVEPNTDVSGFVVRWRITGDTHWRNNYFSKDARDGVIDLPRPFSNYEFQISAYDFVANYAPYGIGPGDAGIMALIAASEPPPQTTGVDSVPRWDGLRIVWDMSTSEAVKFTGGRYEVQLRTTNSFPADTPVEYVTANNFVDVAGLPALSTYFYRVRAIDSANQVGPWSIVDSATLPPFPVASATDGIAPATAPTTLRATGGLNYVNLSWPRVTNNDEVSYEVYMGTATGVTAIAANFAGQSSGTSLMVATLPNGTPLAQETSYYFKVRAVDGDGPGPLSVEATTQLTQVLSTDLGINMGGENLYYNSSLDVDSDANGVANYWTIYNNTAQTEPHTASLVAGRDGVAKAQRVQWTGINTSTKGIYGGGPKVLRPNTEYVLSFYARGNGGSGFDIVNNTAFAMLEKAWIENDALTTTYKRYIVKFKTPATVEDANTHLTVVGHSVNGTSGAPAWIEIDDMQVEAGNLATAYKAGTVSIAKLATGKFETADMIIATGGRIISQTYVNNPNTGFLITDTGITIKDGAVDAKTLIANSTFTSNLYVGALLEVASGGSIRSANYSNGVGSPAAGFRIDSVGIDIRTGTVAAGTFGAGTITSPDIRVGANGKITVDSTGSIQSNNWNPVGPTGWKIDSTGITMDGNSKINVNSIESGLLTSTYIRIGSGGFIASATWDAQVGSRWLLQENAFTMVNGTITGSTIITDQLYSAGSEVSGGVSRRKFSINAGGYAEFTGMFIYGNATLGNDANTIIQSGNYNGQSVGWRIHGSGVAYFFQLNTWSMNVYGNTTVGGGGGDYIKSANYDGQNGWAIRGGGYADFWGGLFVVGSGGGGQIRLTNWGSGESLIQFLQPGDFSRFAHMKASGQNFDIRGGYGGALVFTADTTVRSSLHHAVDYDIWAGRNLGSGNRIDSPLVVASSELHAPGDFSGDPVFRWAGTTVNAHYAILGQSGRLNRGNQFNSSRKFKNNIETLVIRPEDVIALEPKTFYFNEEQQEIYGSGMQVGFIAEEAHDLGLRDWVSYNKNSEDELIPTGFNYPHFGVAQQVVLRDHDKRVKELEDKVEELLNLLASRS